MGKSGRVCTFYLPVSGKRIACSMTAGNGVLLIDMAVNVFDQQAKAHRVNKQPIILSNTMLTIMMYSLYCDVVRYE